MFWRQAANRTIPDDWANRPKVGFPVPIRYWFREERYYKLAREYFTSPEARQFFNSDMLVKLLDEHRAEKGKQRQKNLDCSCILNLVRTVFSDKMNFSVTFIT